MIVFQEAGIAQCLSLITMIWIDMKVYVNNIPVDLLPGMTVRHALIQAGILEKKEKSCPVFDEWGNELGLDGVLSEGQKIYLK